MLVLNADGKRVDTYQKTNASEWRFCECAEAQDVCACCEVDVVKACAEIHEMNTTTQNRLVVDYCPREAR